MLSAAPASWLRVQNLAFTDNQMSANYDWDSVATVPEPALVANASVMHSIDGRLKRPDPLPSMAHVDGFVADYEAVRGAPFSDHQREVLTADQRWIAGYGRPLPARRPTRHLPRRRSVAGLGRILREFLDRSAPGSRTVALRRLQPALVGTPPRCAW